MARYDSTGGLAAYASIRRGAAGASALKINGGPSALALLLGMIEGALSEAQHRR